MKTIGVLWRDPQGNLKPEKFDTAAFTIRTEPGWLKIMTKDDGPFRLIPSDKVCVVEWIEEKEESLIASPHAVPPLPVPRVS